MSTTQEKIDELTDQLVETDLTEREISNIERKLNILKNLDT